MNIKHCVLLLLVSLLFCGCASYQSAHRDEGCDSAIKQYSRMIRWQEAEKASIIFIEDTQRPAFDKAAEALRRRSITMVDYRVLSHECLLEKNRARATVEFDYLIMPDARLKTVTDHQAWEFRDKTSDDVNLKQGWKLTSPLPEFK
jgi:hypothetical protein